MQILIIEQSQPEGRGQLDVPTLPPPCDLDCAIERDDPEYDIALAELAKTGRYMVGGGAAPLFLLKRA